MNLKMIINYNYFHLEKIFDMCYVGSINDFLDNIYFYYDNDKML